MNKLVILFLLSLCALLSNAQSSDASLTSQTNVIRNETAASANTRARVADMFQGLIDSKLSRSNDLDLVALEALSTFGIAVRTAGNTWVTRTLVAGDGMVIINEDGVSGNPAISVNPDSVVKKNLGLQVITYSGNTGFDLVNSSAATTLRFRNNGASGMHIGSVSSSTVYFLTNNQFRLRLSNLGLAVIGSGSEFTASAALDVHGNISTTTPGFRLRASSSLLTTPVDGVFEYTSGQPLHWTYGSTRHRILTDGANMITQPLTFQSTGAIPLIFEVTDGTANHQSGFSATQISVSMFEGVIGSRRSVNINASDEGISIDDQEHSKGIVGGADYSANYDDLTYVQKVYADLQGISRASTSTAGGTITLDLDTKRQRMFVGSASFSTAKTIAFSNTGEAHVFNFFFEVTNVAAVLAMPTTVLMSDANFDGDDWTPPAIGRYEMGGSFDGTNWWVKITGSFN